MSAPLLPFPVDPHLIEIAVCLGAIWVLRWIESMK